MNAYTGATYDLPIQTAVGQPITQDMWPSDLTVDASLLTALEAGEPVVAVDAEVVQRLRLGDRELRRRKQRR
jgi:hypothetical protein